MAIKRKIPMPPTRDEMDALFGSEADPNQEFGSEDSPGEGFVGPPDTRGGRVPPMPIFPARKKSKLTEESEEDLSGTHPVPMA